MSGASVDAGAALALAGAYGVDARAAATLIAQAAHGVAAGVAKRSEGGPATDEDQ